MILKHVNDKKTLIACTLSGRPLLSGARRALHADVCIPCQPVDCHGSVESTLTRYQSTDLARYARSVHLCSEACYPSVDEQLLDLLVILATWKHESVVLNPAFFRELRPSLVHTLIFSYVTMPMNELLCAIFLFPKLLHLEVLVSWTRSRSSGNDELRELSCRGARPPHLHRLVLYTQHSNSAILEALYPIEEQVPLRYLALGGTVDDSLVRSVVKRAQQLEELCFLNPMPFFMVGTFTFQ